MKTEMLDMTVEKEYDDSGTVLYRSRGFVVWTVKLGENLILDVTCALHDNAVKRWLRPTLHEHRRLTKTPLLVSICAYRGLPVPAHLRPHIRPKTHPTHPSNLYCGISICIGGSSVLLYQYYPFHSAAMLPRINALRDLLGDSNVTVVGLDMGRVSEKLEAEWDVIVARPVDLKDIARRAYPHDAIWAVKNGKKKKSVERIGLEELAGVVMSKVRLEKKPAREVERDWGLWDEDNEDEMAAFAARDAYIAYEIGARCLKMVG